METHAITRANWPAFFDRFSKDHPGLFATVQVIGADLGAQEEARQMPFTGITAERTSAGADQITIYLGTESGAHVEHRIAAPVSVWWKPGDANAVGTLEIEARDGTKTILSLAAPPAPGR